MARNKRFYLLLNNLKITFREQWYIQKGVSMQPENISINRLQADLFLLSFPLCRRFHREFLFTIKDCKTKLSPRKNLKKSNSYLQLKFKSLNAEDNILNKLLRSNTLLMNKIYFHSYFFPYYFMKHNFFHVIQNL